MMDPGFRRGDEQVIQAGRILLWLARLPERFDGKN